jgi:hypothetical protein
MHIGNHGKPPHPEWRTIPMIRNMLSAVWGFFFKLPDFSKMTRQQRRDWYNRQW